MSEREIELWEEKAKQGLRRRDTYLQEFISQMRQALYSKPTGAQLALYNLGSETTSWENKGQLSLNETALRNALASDPDGIKQLFTAAKEGLSAQVTTIVNNTAKISMASPGALVSLAGAKNWSGNATSNTYYEKIQSISDRITQLNKTYAKERERYWNQFNNMETILASYNTQSSMISQYFSD